MFLRINLSSKIHNNLLRRLSLLRHDAFIVIFRETQHFIDDLFIFLLMVLIFIHDKSRGPIPFVEVHEHLFFKFIFAVVDDDGVVVAVESMNECLDGWFVDMSHVAGGLPGFLSKHHELWIDEPETVDDDLSLDGLYGIDDERDGSGVERLKAVLCVDVSGGEPASESWMGMVPSNHHFSSARLLEHVEHFGLEYRIDGFDGYGGTGLWHGKYVDAVDGVIVYELSEHEAHDFHGYTCSSVFEHFEEGQRGYMHLFGAVW
mmetsp:Transcript_120/g.157  ORF Transcript_120/g.157 Transcript_120/m.157 type:complete len:260 (+) Transcript_120:259-1038(+)